MIDIDIPSFPDPPTITHKPNISTPYGGFSNQFYQNTNIHNQPNQNIPSYPTQPPQNNQNNPTHPPNYSNQPPQNHPSYPTQPNQNIPSYPTKPNQNTPSYPTQPPLNNPPPSQPSIKPQQLPSQPTTSNSSTYVPQQHVGDFVPSESDIQLANKYSKFVMSSLSFEDVPAAVKYLRLTLKHLTGSENWIKTIKHVLKNQIIK